MFRRIAALVLGVGIAVGVAGPASAHVHVSPEQVDPGATVQLTFRVPNEESNATTTKVEVTLPPGAKFTTVSAQPLEGWSEYVNPGSVSWETTGSGIPVQGTADFKLNIGPMPAGESLAFKTLQTYSNGDIARWIQVPASGSAEPENPAPVVQVTGTAVTASTVAPAQLSNSPITTLPPAAVDSPSSERGLPLVRFVVLSIVAIAIATAVYQGLRRPPRSSLPTPQYTGPTATDIRIAEEQAEAAKTKTRTGK